MGWWADHAEERDVNLVREHYGDHVESIDDLASTADYLSQADASHPESYELRGGHLPYTLALTGAAVQRTSHATHVGALYPPPRSLDATRRPHLSSHGGGSTSPLLTRSEWLDFTDVTHALALQPQ